MHTLEKSKLGSSTFGESSAIWPLYYLGLALGVGVAFLPGGHPSDLINTGWFAIFMGAWVIATNHFFQNPASVLWSISVEEQFYLFAPWTVKFFTRRSLFVFCIALIFISNGCLYYLGKVSAPDHSIWANSLVEFECFAAGILLCIVLRSRTPKIALWLRLIVFAAACSCWFFACYRLHSRFEFSSENPGSWPLIGGYAMGAGGICPCTRCLPGGKSETFPGGLSISDVFPMASMSSMNLRFTLRAESRLATF